jgi:predicted ribosomally synthesized peptide with SipW-like signal peptide
MQSRARRDYEHVSNERRKKMNGKAILASLLTIGVAATMLGVGTFAYFSDTETSSGNTFTAGTLDITLGSATYSMNILNMKPGDTKTVTLDVNSIGTLPLNYTITTSLTGSIMKGVVDNDPYVSAIRVDSAPYSAPETLSAANGTDNSDTVEVDITLPYAAGNEYQGLSGSLDITFDAVSQ